MKLLVFGATGQVAKELQRRMPSEIDAVFVGRGQADLSDPTSPRDVLTKSTADVVINAAAYTAVDKAEAEPDIAHRVNAEAVASIAETLAATRTPLVHISTDYVFDGNGVEPWKPDSPTGPLSVYGKTKLAGEEAVRAVGSRNVILRTSWVFSAHGSNFVKSMLRLGSERDQLAIVADQVGGPTPAADIADALIAIARLVVEGHGGGTYHFAGAPDTSWADFAREIFHQSSIDCIVEDITTREYPTPAARPLNSRLDCETLSRDFGIRRPDWRAGLTEVLMEIT